MELTQDSSLTLAQPRKSLSAKIFAIDELTAEQMHRMYNLFCQYYEGHNERQFISDLMEKTDVILLFDKSDQSIQGFSTLLKLTEQKLNAGNQTLNYNAIYSGDTVINKTYWGNSALGFAFLKYLWLEKLKAPFEPLYWFLISKGYKTYLMMANNFTLHYPRYEAPTPILFKKVMDSFYTQKFPKNYSAQTGLIIPTGVTCHLKQNVADICNQTLKNKRIEFFQQQNPNWNLGQELTCLAEMTLSMPFKYALKRVWKKLCKQKLS